jgi:anti-sigma factor RsiW
LTGTRRLEELLWQRQDGEIAPADRAWLEAELARDPEAAAMAAEVTAVHQVLAEAGPVHLPAELGGRIRSAVDAASPPGRWGWRARRAGGPSGAASFPTWQRGWAYLAAGIALGVGLSLVVRRGPDLDPAELAGSAGWSRSEEVAAQEAMALAEGRGSLAVGRSGGTLVVRLEWTGPGAAELALSGGGGLTVGAPEPPAGATLRELGPAVWVLRLPGPARVTLKAAPADPAQPVEIEVRAEGRSWARRSVRLEDLTEPR